MLKVFAIYDSKVQAYMTPWFARAAGEASRQFEDLVNDGKSLPSSHPADFTLFEIGEYDETKGVIMGHKAHISLSRGIDAKKSPQSDLPMPGLGRTLKTAPVQSQQTQ